MLIKTVEKLAKQVRIDHTRDMYGSFALSGKSKESILNMDLTCECAHASFRLFEELKNRGYKPELALVEDHVFVTLNGQGIDLTASQYNAGDVKFPPPCMFLMRKKVTDQFFFVPMT